MTLTAKYAGKCKVCSGAIRAGEQIAWSKDAGAAHVACSQASAPAKSAASPTAGASAPAKRVAAPSVLGSPEGAAATLHRMCPSRPNAAEDMGRVFRAGKRAGKVAGQIVVVIGAEVGRYLNQDDADDFGEGEAGWPLATHVRLATEAEAAPVLEAETAKAKVATARTEIQRRFEEARRQNHDTVPAREEGGQKFNLSTSTTTCETVTVYADGRAVWYHGGYYDDYRTSWGVTTDGAEVAALCEAAGYKERS